MSIKKASLAAILVKLGVAADEAKANEIIDLTDEKEVSIPEGTRVYSKIDWEGDGTDKKPGVERMLKDDGVKLGKDLQVKYMKEKAGLSYDGKDPDKFLESFKEHVSKEAGTSVDEKVKSRDKTIDQLKTALEEEKGKVVSVTTQLKTIQEDQELINLLPKDRDPKFSDKHYVMALRADLNFAEEDGKRVVKKNGEIVKNDKFEPLSPADVIANHFKESNWLKAADGANGGAASVAGRGGGDGKATGKFGSLKELNKHLEDNGIHPGSEKASQLIGQALKENPEMDMSLK